MFYNLLGALVWAASLVLSGFLLNAIFPDIIHYMEFVIICIVLITFLPLAMQYLKLRKTPVAK